jgi:hypothetical protein
VHHRRTIGIATVSVSFRAVDITVATGNSINQHRIVLQHYSICISRTCVAMQVASLRNRVLVISVTGSSRIVVVVLVIGRQIALCNIIEHLYYQLG